MCYYLQISKLLGSNEDCKITENSLVYDCPDRGEVRDELYGQIIGGTDKGEKETSRPRMKLPEIGEFFYSLRSAYQNGQQMSSF